MPKNERGEVVCINHPETIMKKDEDKAVVSALTKNADGSKSVQLGKGWIFEVHTCNECHYTEFYESEEV